MSENIEDKINHVKGIGNTPREAYESLWEILSDTDCFKFVQLKDGKWVIGMDVVESTQKEIEDWEKFTKNLYNN